MTRMVCPSCRGEGCRRCVGGVLEIEVRRPALIVRSPRPSSPRQIALAKMDPAERGARVRLPDVSIQKRDDI